MTFSNIVGNILMAESILVIGAGIASFVLYMIETIQNMKDRKDKKDR